MFSTFFTPFGMWDSTNEMPSSLKVGDEGGGGGVEGNKKR